ncbi:hypothetical protein HZH68_002100 [Vespula germanica]|uniref:Uncharacterized protein n=1 Tax=Vespula germanica TaxID=30212 RepID=A0A834L0A6_VESGE|nr:hypothetical protein HZH68_002100 [Vespula germanica]
MSRYFEKKSKSERLFSGKLFDRNLSLGRLVCHYENGRGEKRRKAKDEEEEGEEEEEEEEEEGEEEGEEGGGGGGR